MVNIDRHVDRDISWVISLNFAQRRNIANWGLAGLEEFVLHCEVPIPPGNTVGSVANTIRLMVGRHESLRSRLVRDGNGKVYQEVRNAAGVNPDIRVVSAAGGDGRGPVIESIDPWSQALASAIRLDSNQRPVALDSYISHVFMDGMGSQHFGREIATLLSGGLLDEVGLQAHDLVEDSFEESVRYNTDIWFRALKSRSQSSMYQLVRASLEVAEEVTRILLPHSIATAVRMYCRRHSITLNSFWCSFGSFFHSRATGWHEQVFRVTAANRNTPEALRSLTQLATAVFIPVVGGHGDSFQDRVHIIFEALTCAIPLGFYDAERLVEMLNKEAPTSSERFRPAFEVNYLPGPFWSEESGTPGTRSRVVESSPIMPRADLVILIEDDGAQMSVEVVTRSPFAEKYPSGSISSAFREMLDAVVFEVGV